MPYAAVQCFLVEPTDVVRRFARCFIPSADNRCDASGMGYCNAELFIDDVVSPLTAEGIDRSRIECRLGASETVWPTNCPCGTAFLPQHRTTYTDRVYRRLDNGLTLSLRDVEKSPGAVYRATWMEPHWVGLDGKSYACVLPNGNLWMIDGGCNNCTRPDEKHHCWIREGEAPNFTVGKGGPGANTCNAGAGSVLSGDYHGFLIGGILSAG